MEAFQENLMTLIVLVLGAIVVIVREEIAKFLKDRYGIDDHIDKAVLHVEDEIPVKKAGKSKKKMVRDMVTNHLKNTGAGLAGRLAVKLFGKVGKSIDMSVKKRINGNK